MKTRFAFIPITLLLILLNLHTTAQNNFKTSIGIGLFELINLGFDYHFKQSEAGLSIGTWPTELNGLSLTCNYYYHFAGKSRFSEVRPWFVRAGINMLRYKYTYSIDYDYCATLRVGREFNFSNKIGVGIDAGASYLFYRYSKKLGENPFPTGNILFFLPNGSFKLFYRF